MASQLYRLAAVRALHARVPVALVANPRNAELVS